MSLNCEDNAFGRKLVNYFRNALGSPDVGTSRTLLNAIRKSRVQFSSELRHENFENVYFDVLFSVFEISPWIDKKVIQNLMRKYIIRKRNLHVSSVNNVLSLSAINDCNLLDFSWVVKPFSGDKISCEKFIYLPLISDYETVERLLRYGARFEISCDFVYNYFSIVIDLTDTILNSMYEDVQWQLTEVLLDSHTYKTNMRLYFVLITLYAMLSKQVYDIESTRNTIKSLTLLFKAMQEPLVTVSEIRRFLNAIATGETKEDLIDELCQKFVDYFPKSQTSLQPRTLKHLSRCEVRRHLAQSNNLPHGVLGFSIPTSIKNYLLLQKTTDEHYPPYVAALSSRTRRQHDTACSRKRKSV